MKKQLILKRILDIKTSIKNHGIGDLTFFNGSEDSKGILSLRESQKIAIESYIRKQVSNFSESWILYPLEEIEQEVRK